MRNSESLPSDDSLLAAARARIRRAYDPALLGSLAHRLADRLTEHLRGVEAGAGPVLNWREPTVNVAQAADCLHASPSSGDRGLPTAAESLDCFDRLVRLTLARGQNLHHPRYIGHQVPPPVPVAGLFDALSAVANHVMAIYEMGPWVTAVERALIDALGRQFQLPPGFSGLVTHGGSLANLTALLTARNVTLASSWEQGLAAQGRPPVLVSQADSHYCVTRSAGILGLGTRQIVGIPLDARRRMDANRLDETLAELRRGGTPIIAVSACAGATPIGAFDPLHDIADVCQRHSVWLHVDAAHGAAAAFSARHRQLISGLQRADSFVCDAHKMLFVPALCAFVFYREGRVKFETFRQDAPYLFDPSAPGMAEVDSGIVTVECTKRAAAYGLWGLWSMFGPGLFGDLVDVTFATARKLYEKLAAAADFETLHEPQANILAFRYRPPGSADWSPERIGNLNRAIRRELITSGEFYIVQTNLDGVGALRVSVMNPLTDESHLDELLAAIRRVGGALP